MKEQVTIKPGWGYHDITSHPYGGDFHRVARSGPGLPVSGVKSYPGVSRAFEGLTDTGRRIVFKSDSVED